jgi:hypothetical protein
MLGVTTKSALLLAKPFTVTTTGPVVAVDGTDVVMLVLLQLEAVAATPLNVTVLLPCVASKFVPVIVTPCPPSPDAGFSDAMTGVGKTVNARPLLETPCFVTTTGPVEAPSGTVATMVVGLQLVTTAVAPLNVTVLEPCVLSKLSPVSVTAWPAAPVVGLSDVSTDCRGSAGIAMSAAIVAASTATV